MGLKVIAPLSKTIRKSYTRDKPSRCIVVFLPP